VSAGNGGNVGGRGPARADRRATSGAGAGRPAADRPLRIGEVAAAAGVSTRTLRYYQELGLLQPSGHTPGLARRYGAADVERLNRILELRDLLGFNLDEIAEILRGEDRLAGLRAEWLSGKGLSARRREEILAEAASLNRHQQEQVRAKLDRLKDFLSELESKAGRYQELGAELRAGTGTRSPA
jgi:DNA-binding transcriptional MerR regulator